MIRPAAQAASPGPGDTGLAAPVHFIGLGGAGMSAVARVLLGRGVAVSGSDAAESRALRALERLGAVVHVGHRGENVRNAATVVVSSAIRPDNPELAAARSCGLPVLHRSEALAAAMSGRDVIAVAGTHGKTTTTAMVAVMLQQAGRRPSFAIGGDVAALGVNAAWEDGTAFVAEADESDGSFLNYRPKVAVVTNVEPDHLDHYGSAEAVHEAFDRFAGLLPPHGLLLACADDPGAAALAARAAGRMRVRTYGYAADADFRVSGTRAVGSASNSRISFSVDGLESEHELQLSVPGEHNVLNASAAFAVGLELGLDPSLAAAGLAGFSGASRRFEARGAAGGIRVFDDYAHHPTEVAAALAAARTVAGEHRVHALFQPHLFSRTREFAAGFAAALELADTASVLDIYAAREDPVPGVTSRLITEKLRIPGGYFPDPAAALGAMVDAAARGDILLTMGAGDVTRYGEELVRRLAERHGSEGSGH